MFNSLWPHGLQHTRLHYFLEFAQIHVHRVSDAIYKCLFLFHALFLLPSIFPSIRVFSNESALCIKWQSIGASDLASALSVNIQGWFSLELTGLISCSARDSQESSPAGQFESISSSVNILVFLSLNHAQI